MKNFRFALILATTYCTIFAADISVNFQSLVQKNGNTLQGFLKYMLTNFSTQQIGLIYASKQRCDAINQDRSVDWICILNLRIALLDNDAKQMLCGKYFSAYFIFAHSLMRFSTTNLKMLVLRNLMLKIDGLTISDDCVK